MRANKKTVEARETLNLADGLRTIKSVSSEDQEAAYCLSAMLGGLEMMRLGADTARGWGNKTQGLNEALDSHFDKIESILKKYRAGILPEAATA